MTRLFAMLELDVERNELTPTAGLVSLFPPEPSAHEEPCFEFPKQKDQSVRLRGTPNLKEKDYTRVGEPIFYINDLPFTDTHTHTHTPVDTHTHAGAGASVWTAGAPEGNGLKLEGLGGVGSGVGIDHGKRKGTGSEWEELKIGHQSSLSSCHDSLAEKG